MQWGAENSAHAQNDEGTSTDGWNADEHSEEESGADEWSEEKFNANEWSYYSTDCECARSQGTLSLILSARISLEVFELVVDKMDTPTLIAAALVCAAWYPRAMHNLYHTVEILSRPSYDLLFKQCHASPRVKQWLARTCKLVVDEVGAYSDVCTRTALSIRARVTTTSIMTLAPFKRYRSRSLV